ncbi:type II toxin-antitoxin system PemK/MazF family toxin [Rhizorhabdus dicambivorans]|uniref:Type II toxin-antitoxin system PemK/MazF family toxin n=1 Tax=Rhizorhabdus dicambivorans TaxID=1850238 RepID=A0A2A4FWS4_9SPHN|nr:type II toxin-antitoxin system PemK/MazF family toxin [Rhizorhabdus dicambivorans]ATE63069.1 type II toxin-antitoxin system PemK/MazF family toxin [Rhizorhabdus dicambivorans]PCE43246.1 type II toxin-antitoxin system PemK/MazF family toxin [Rhizorhabdus dicambivorans]
MKRGDLVTVAAGSGFGGKPRPALVLQSDAYPTGNLVLALMTSSLTPEETIRPRIEPSEANGLRRTSDVMVDILVTVPRHKVDSTIGILSDDDLGRVERSLMIFLGLAG